MNTIPDTKDLQNDSAELAQKIEDKDLEEIGQLSETRGSISGSKGDGGFGASFT